MEETILKYDNWLASLYAIGARKRVALRAMFGSAKGVFEQSEETVRKANLLTKKELATLFSVKTKSGNFARNKNGGRDEAAENMLTSEYENLRKKDVTLIPFYDEHYPPKLLTIPDFPYALYVKGNLRNDTPSIAIVGARMGSAYGKYMTGEIGKQLAKNGISVISGMARGIDGEAHRAALSENAHTVAVLGCGVDVPYPSRHRILYEEILSNGGAVVSELPLGTQPLKEFFPMRNRIISGLSDAVVVIEAREKSGSLITADFAVEQGRDVFAVPGRSCDDLSKGCNRLISQGAGIILSAEDFMRTLSEFYPVNLKTGEEVTEKFNLEKQERLVYSCLDFYASGIDEICEKTDLSMLTVLEALLSLTDKGLAKECFLNQYTKLR